MTDEPLAFDILRSMGEAVITTDLDGKVTYVNPSAVRMTGWTNGQITGHALDSVLPFLSDITREPIADIVNRCLKADRPIELEEGVVLIRRDGAEVPIGDSVAPIRDETGTTVGVVFVIRDESEQRRVRNGLSFEASHDALTGLVNRREFERQLLRLVSEIEETETSHVLLYLDLDHFKKVNDLGGQGAGDALLRAIGPMIASSLRPNDTLARLGGDEFAILLEYCPVEVAERIADSIRSVIAEWQFELAGASISVGVSIGILPLTSTDHDVNAILRAADAACYLAKARGGGRVHLSLSL